MTEVAESSSSAAEQLPAVPARRARRRSRGAARRPLDRGLIVACAVIAAGISLIVWGFFGARTGDDGIDRPDAIERVSPVDAIQVLQQESIVVDLSFGFEARLIVDGIELETTRLGEADVDPGELAPGEQLSIPPTAVFDVGNGILTFTPTDGAPIESFAEGRHTATVLFWRIEDGPENARSYTWSFDVV